jgi:hypothetical protein
MQTQSHPVRSFQPHVFHYSLDWRFLLPGAALENMLVVFETDSDFIKTLEHVGVPVQNHLAFFDLPKKGKNSAHSVVLPFGLPVGWVGAQQKSQIEFYRAIRSLLEQNGYLLVGFNNVWNFLANADSKYYSSTPRRVVDQLWKAGFTSVKLFGAMPNLQIPEYTFDLDAEAMRFALHHRFKRKPTVLTLLQIMVRTNGLANLSNFLPCYFALATV